MAFPSKEEVLTALKPVQDPEIRIGIVDLGLVYDVMLEEEIGKITVKMTLTTPSCPYGEMLVSMTHRACEEISDEVKDVEIKLVWEPTWNPEEMCSDSAKDILGIW